jgi:hypothetical protein
VVVAPGVPGASVGRRAPPFGSALEVLVGGCRWCPMWQVMSEAQLGNPNCYVRFGRGRVQTSFWADGRRMCAVLVRCPAWIV